MTSFFETILPERAVTIFLLLLFLASLTLAFCFETAFWPVFCFATGAAILPFFLAGATFAVVVFLGVLLTFLVAANPSGAVQTQSITSDSSPLLNLCMAYSFENVRPVYKKSVFS